MTPCSHQAPRTRRSKRPRLEEPTDIHIIEWDSVTLPRRYDAPLGVHSHNIGEDLIKYEVINYENRKDRCSWTAPPPKLHVRLVGSGPGSDRSLSRTPIVRHAYGRPVSRHLSPSVWS